MTLSTVDLVSFLFTTIIVSSRALPKEGKIQNCYGSTSNETGIDLSATWEPFRITPNTWYTINGNLTIHEDIEEAIEGGELWIPEASNPIYTFPENEVSCEESGVLQALFFFNITCPLKKGTKEVVTDFRHFFPETEVAVPIRGDFRVKAYLKDLHGRELSCWTTDITIGNNNK